MKERTNKPKFIPFLYIRFLLLKFTRLFYNRYPENVSTAAYATFVVKAAAAVS